MGDISGLDLMMRVPLHVLTSAKATDLHSHGQMARYTASPHLDLTREARRLLKEYLCSSRIWDDHRWEGELKISSMKRQRDRLGRFPVCKGRKLIAKFRPRAFLECIISIGYRSLWDARLRSAQIMERYSHHDCLVHLTYRGSLPCWESRVIDVIQHVQCYGPDMEEQETANQDTRCIDLIFKSIEESKSSLRGQQSGSRRSIVNLIAYRIEWDEKDQGSYITSIEDVEGVDSLPSYLWHQLSKDIPRQGLDLGNCMTRNGLPPYIIDVDHCIEIVDTNFSHQSRTTSFRHITRHSGEYRIAIDRLVMYSDGIKTVQVLETSADKVDISEDKEGILVRVKEKSIDCEHVIIISAHDEW